MSLFSRNDAKEHAFLPSSFVLLPFELDERSFSLHCSCYRCWWGL